MKQGKAIIIGAGSAGLTAAVEIQRSSTIESSLIEVGQQAGGISRTVRHKGNHMDIGLHRFFPKSDRVVRWWLDLMPVWQGRTRPVNFSTRASSAICLGGLILLLAFTLARFAYDASRLAYPANDLTTVWVSSKAFDEGKDPYNDTQEFVKIWVENRPPSAVGCTANYNCILHNLPMGYPWTALPLLAPLTFLHWSAAVYTYLAGSTALFVAMILMLAQKLQLPWSNLKKWYMIAFGLALAPLHAGIHMSNLSTLVIGLLGMGVIFMRKRPYLSGIALAISVCLKPQVAFLFFAYPWLRRQWRTAFTGLAVCATIFTSSLLWMGFHNINVYRSYLGALAQFNSQDSYNSFTYPGPIRYLLINLQVVVFQFTRSAVESNILSWLLFLILAAASALLIRSRVSEGNEGIDIAIISVLTLLPFYQHIYSAALLIFVIYWAFDNWQLKGAKAALLLMLPLLFPFVAMTWGYPPLAGFVERHHLGSHFFWNAFIMPYVVWIELCLVLIMLTELYGTAAISRRSLALLYVRKAK